MTRWRSSLSRAAVLETPNDGDSMVAVRLLDEGEDDFAAADELFHLPPALAGLPGAAARCRLRGWGHAAGDMSRWG